MSRNTFKKRLFWLTTGYVVGGIVVSMFNKKRGITLRKELEEAKEKWEGSFKILFDNLVATHSSMFDTAKEEIMTEENIELFNEKKEEFLKLLNTYKAKGNVILRDLKKKWEWYMDEAKKRIEELYEEWVDNINNMKAIAPRKAQELKRNLKKLLVEIQDEMEELIKK